MKHTPFILLFSVISFFSCHFGTPAQPATQPGSDGVLQEAADSIPAPVKKLLKYYSTRISGYKDNKIIFKDGTSMVYDDGVKNKSFQQLLDKPDIEDQFAFAYSRGDLPVTMKKNFDPGRIRNEAFFKKIYGETKEAVSKQLREITWCPKLVGQVVKVTTVNGIDTILQKISAELDQMPQYKEYIKNIGGTFNWRLINGTDRLSMHSFGMTVDINTAYSHYWQWDCKCTSEDVALKYRNKIPKAIVAVFEKYGFIWGGRWYHYDTMHFEYRPELVF